MPANMLKFASLETGTAHMVASTVKCYEKHHFPKAKFHTPPTRNPETRSLLTHFVLGLFLVWLLLFVSNFVQIILETFQKVPGFPCNYWTFPKFSGAHMLSPSSMPTPINNQQNADINVYVCVSIRRNDAPSPICCKK